MSTDLRRRINLIGAILGGVLLILGCVNTKFFATKNPTEKLPLRTLTVETDPTQRDKLAKLLSVFAETHDLEVDVAFYTNKNFEGPFFYIMYGENLEVSGYFTPDNKVTDIRFYEKSKDMPPLPEYLDEIYNDLKAFIREIPDAVIIEEK